MGHYELFLKYNCERGVSGPFHGFNKWFLFHLLRVVVTVSRQCPFNLSFADFDTLRSLQLLGVARDYPDKT